MTAPELEAFKSCFQAWWGNLQPDWRKSEQWPLNQETIDGDWGAIDRGGPNGIFMVLMGLAFWLDAKHRKKKSDKLLNEYLVDVHWVLQNITLDRAQSGRKKQVKRPASTSPPTSPKRRRTKT